MRVYRVEHGTEKHLGTPRGPYRDMQYEAQRRGLPWPSVAPLDTLAKRLNERHKDGDHPPIRWSREIGHIEYEEFCGFTSVQQLLSWFDLRDRQELRDHGYQISEYEVADDLVRSDAHQAVFVHHEAELVGVVPWS